MRSNQLSYTAFAVVGLEPTTSCLTIVYRNSVCHTINVHKHYMPLVALVQHFLFGLSARART